MHYHEQTMERTLMPLYVWELKHEKRKTNQRLFDFKKKKELLPMVHNTNCEVIIKTN